MPQVVLIFVPSLAAKHFVHRESVVFPEILISRLEHYFTL